MKSSKKEEKVNKAIELQSKAEKPDEESEEVNPDLDMENNDWAKSPASPLSSFKDSEGFDSKKRW